MFNCDVPYKVVPLTLLLIGMRVCVDSGNEYTNVFGATPFDGTLTPYIANCFKPEVDTCILDGEMLGYHAASKTFGQWRNSSRFCQWNLYQYFLAHTFFRYIAFILRLLFFTLFI